MELWLVWIIVAAVFAVGEIASLSLFLAPFAGAALVAALIAGVGGGLAVSTIGFLVVSTVLLAALRPIARHHLRTESRTRTGTARLVGETAVVLDPGTVKLDGETWSARAYDDEAELEPGTKVTVMEIRGATALVSQ